MVPDAVKFGCCRIAGGCVEGKGEKWREVEDDTAEEES